MVENAEATQSQNPQTNVGVARTPSTALAAKTEGDASLTESTTNRYHLRQEPDGVIPQVRICAGGRPKGRSLPRPYYRKNASLPS